MDKIAIQIKVWKGKRITKVVKKEAMEWKINIFPWETLTHRNMCDKKQIVRETKVVVGIKNNTKGLNVYTLINYSIYLIVLLYR